MVPVHHSQRVELETGVRFLLGRDLLRPRLGRESTSLRVRSSAYGNRHTDLRRLVGSH